MAETWGRWAYSLFLLSGLLVFASWGWAQEIGEVVAVEGVAARRPPPAGEPLELGSVVALLNQLQAQPESKVGVLLDTGPKFVLRGDVAITIAEQTPTGAILDLARGTLQAITFGGAIQIRTPSGGQVTARSTGFIVSCGTPPLDLCGPSRTPTSSTCLFVGVHGDTQVAAAGVTASLGH